MIDTGRQKFDRRCRPSVPSLTHPKGAGGDRLGQVVRSGRAIQARQCDHHLTPVTGDAPPWLAPGELPSALAVHLGVGRVTEPQFDAGTYLVLEGRPNLRPPRSRHRDVNAERKPLSGKRGDRCPRGRRTPGAASPIRRRRGTRRRKDRRRASGSPAARRRRYSAIESIPKAAKLRLPCPHQGFHHRDRAPAQVDIEPAGHRSDVGQRPQRRQRPATEVQAIELHFRRTVGGRQRHHQSAQRRRLTRSWSADHRDISCGRVQFGDKQFAPLLVRAVDEADRHRQGRVGVVPGNQHVQGGRARQRRQPHPMSRCATVRETVHDGMEQQCESCALERLSCSMMWPTGAAVNNIGFADWTEVADRSPRGSWCEPDTKAVWKRTSSPDAVFR